MEVRKIVVGAFETNCYILKSGNELCVIDPGECNNRLIDGINKMEGQLKYIINTHYHDDHVCGNERIRELFGGKILIHKEERDYINFNVNKYLNEGDIISFGESELKVIHTPGHSSGSICLLSGKYIFTGDTVFLNGCGRADLLGGDEQELEESLLRLSKIIMPRMIIAAGHGKSFLYKK